MPASRRRGKLGVRRAGRPNPNLLRPFVEAFGPLDKLEEQVTGTPLRDGSGRASAKT
jgi:hypothetical protein